MNRFPCFKTTLLLCIFALHLTSFAQQASRLPASRQVYFSPCGGATSAIILSLEDTKILVLVQASNSTSLPIAEALVRAHSRSVTVQVLLDKSQRTERFTAASLLDRAGIRTHIDAIAHHKVTVIDKEIVISGSFSRPHMEYDCT